MKLNIENDTLPDLSSSVLRALFSAVNSRAEITMRFHRIIKANSR